jgi:hypothetical protein
MRQNNGKKRAEARAARDAEANENIQPALVNSATASAAAPLPDGNFKEIMDDIRDQQRTAARDATPGVVRAFHLFVAEFERRARAMPFIRFVANGKPLPVEIGNVDKLQAVDGSGTYYMFPTSENLRMAFAADPEDPTQGQEAQGGPMHGITGRGEKYAGGNVETDMVLDHAKNPKWDGKGSQTGGTGVQRASLGDESAIGAATDDTNVSNVADYGEGHLRPLAPGTVIEQVGKTHSSEPGYIRRTTDVSKLHNKGDMFRVVKDKDAPKTPKANIDSGQDHLDGPGADGKPTVVDTRFADAMKEGQKTATDASAAGAVTAGNSASDIEQDSPGIVGGFGGKQSADASEGTVLDTAQPTIEPLQLVDVSEGVYYPQDWSGKDDSEIIDFLNDHGVPIQTGAKRTDLEALAAGVKPTKAGDGLARQKSDEATPQVAGGVLAGGSNAKIDEDTSKAEAEGATSSETKPAKAPAKKSAAKTPAKPKSSAAKSGGKTISIGGKKKGAAKKASTSKPANKSDAVTTEEAKAEEPGKIVTEEEKNE